MRERIISALLVISLMLSLVLTGCSSTNPVVDPTETSENTAATNESAESTTTSEPTATPTESETTEPPTEPTTETEPQISPTEDDDELSQQQLNSFSMLYYLAITAEEIRISKDNRLLLEDIYTSLLNDINPGKIDERTQEHLQNLRDIIKSYINISIKRERLQYIYNQDKASAIRNAVPDPLAVLSMSNSFDWKRLAASVVYTVVDSYNNYKSASDSADQEFLLSGWELDDEETANIQKNRERAFDYMVDIVQEYGLDGSLTLNENAIKDFAEICAIESVYLKIQRLESEESTYTMLGNYWLELADCYYEIGEYQKCLDCVAKYNELATGIYRKDYNYVQILPKAIVAAQEVYTGDEYVTNVETFVDAIIANTNTDEWSVRYFAAQVYLDLYSKTGNKDYLRSAYKIALDNVSLLLDEQCALNETYLADVKEVEIEEPDYRFLTDEEKKERKAEYKEEKKRLDAYNKALKETRKTELPPLYEPLVLNCDLLFALAAELDIDYAEQVKIQNILQTAENGIFLSHPVNDRYSFAPATADYAIEFTKDKIVVPANLLTQGARIVVTIKNDSSTETFDDWTVTKVEREGSDLSSFYAYVSSKTIKSYEWSVGAEITVNIYNGEGYEPITFKFKVTEYKDNFLIPDKIIFEAV